jgi:AcrR family transcriptional regulator
VPRIDRRPRQRLDEPTRRTAILRAAGEAFSAQPYDKVSVARVARAADASEALVHRYFKSKSGLYVAVIQAGVTLLLDRQRQALDATPARPRERLATTVSIYLDAVAEWATGWLNPLRFPSSEPAEAVQLRREVRDTYATLLRDLLHLPNESRLDYAVYGYLSFLDAACQRWAERDYPAEDREPLTEQAIAALAAALTAAGRAAAL